MLQGRYHQFHQVKAYTYNTASICKTWTLKVHMKLMFLTGLCEFGREITSIFP